MNRLMKTKTGLLLAVILLLSACKQDNWIDWKLQNEMWLTQNARKENVNLSPSGSGLQYTILYEGNPYDAKPSQSATVAIDYTGKLINGVVFEEGSATLSVANLVEGFREGLSFMHVSGDAVFYIPADLGYGSEATGTEGSSSYIPPYSTLIFEVHLSSIIEN